MKIIEPERDDDEQEFVGKDLKVVQQHEKFMKMTLKSMGIGHRDDRNAVIERIKKLIDDEDDATDVWDKKSRQKKDDDDGDWE